MNNHLQDSVHNAGIEIAKVVGANATAWSIALTNVNALLTTISLVLASAFTIVKIIKERNKK